MCYIGSMSEKANMNPYQYVAELVANVKNKGAFLSYRDYLVIAKWVAACDDFDFLLLLLADLIPAQFSSKPNSSLASIDRTVMAKIRHHKNKV